VVALDVFADVDTQRAAEQVYKIGYANSGFDAKQFEAALDQIDTSDMFGFAYGSGFEAQPDLLDRIAKRLPLIGNAPEVVRKLKDASYFFGALDRLEIPHPEVSFTSLANADGWICKEQGGSGGTHVLNAGANQTMPQGQYYQRVMFGTPISMLFAANGTEIKVIGFNQQWVAPTAGKPYRYGGIVGHVNLPLAIKQALQEAAHKITSVFGLRGLNSLDVIWQDDHYWVLEINPRLSSSLDLYQSKESNLFALHVQAVNGDLSHFPNISSRSKARKVIYAGQDLVIAEDLVWPDWLADIPMAPIEIPEHQPICTVLADANTAEEAQALVAKRVEQLSALLFK
jgi:predicted ATP-grasp superfamily ATP-dependent carboligase